MQKMIKLLVAALTALFVYGHGLAQVEITPPPDNAGKGGKGGTATLQSAADRMRAAEDRGNRLGGKDELSKRFAETITPEDLEAHLSFLASDELEGRETGTRGQKIAARYLAAQFRKLGLKPGNGDSWFQEYELLKVEIEDVTLSFDGKDELKMGSDFIFFNKSAMAESFDADLAFAGYGIGTDAYDNFRDLDLVGKAAVVLNGTPEGMDEADYGYKKKVEELMDRGAKAAVFAVPDEDFKQFSGNPWVRHAMRGKGLYLAYEERKTGGGMPAVFVPESTVNEVIKKSKTTCAELRKQLDGSSKVTPLDFRKNRLWVNSTATKEVIVAENVLGLLEGTDKKDEIIVLTAHYDHLGVRDSEIYNGADDDGTGVSAILEVAEAFALAAEAGARPRRSILFMPVSGEEKGLLGSQYYSDHPVYPLEKTVCNLNIDMIGRVDEAHADNEEYVYIIGSDRLSTELHRANELANELVTDLELDYRYNAEDDPNRFYYRSDHYNFARYNVPVIFYFSGVHEDYHRPTDTIEKILFPKTARITRLVFATAWEVAMRDRRLRVDRAN